MIEYQQGQEALIINSYRSRNHPEGILTMTVSELIGLLEWYDPDMPVLIRGYDGYQFNPADNESIESEVFR